MVFKLLASSLSHFRVGSYNCVVLTSESIMSNWVAWGPLQNLNSSHWWRLLWSSLVVVENIDMRIYENCNLVFLMVGYCA